MNQSGGKTIRITRQRPVEKAQIRPKFGTVYINVHLLSSTKKQSF